MKIPTIITAIYREISLFCFFILSNHENAFKWLANLWQLRPRPPWHLCHLMKSRPIPDICSQLLPQRHRAHRVQSEVSSNRWRPVQPLLALLYAGWCRKMYSPTPFSVCFVIFSLLPAFKFWWSRCERTTQTEIDFIPKTLREHHACSASGSGFGSWL